jgi:hypothetical protein
LWGVGHEEPGNWRMARRFGKMVRILSETEPDDRYP